MSKGFTHIVLLLIVTVNLAVAQKTYRFESITVDDGLSQSSVLSIAQDISGYLWIGTQDGLNKYDGYTIKIYRNKEGDSSSLAKNYVSKIFVDNQSAIWVATLGNLSRYNIATDGFINYPLAVEGLFISPNVFVWDIFQSKDGRLVLSTTGGLFHFDPSTGKFQVENEFLSSFGKGVFGYCETKSKGDWVFLRDSMLHRTQGNKEWKSEHHLGTRSYYNNRSDDLYFYSDDQFHGQDQLLKYKSGGWEEWIKVGNLYSLEMCFTASGNIWVSTDNGIFIYEPSGRLLTSITPQEISVTGVNLLRSIYESRDGVIWLGTNGYGLKKYNPQTNQFSYLGSSAVSTMHLNHPYIDAIYTDDDTTIYVSTPNGLDVVNLFTKTSKHFPQQERIKRIVRDQSQLWLCGTEELWFFKNNQIIDTHLRKSDNIAPYPSAKMAFVGSTRIALLDHGAKKNLLQQPSHWDISLLEIIGDTLWVGSGPGTSHIKAFNFVTRQPLTEFSHNPQDPTSFPSGGNIKCILQDSKNRIWIGTTGGLVLYNSVHKNFALFTEKEGLPNNTIYGILEDDEYNLWLSTNKGLCEFNPETKKVRSFEAFDGLQSNEFNTGAYFKSKYGTMYFGGVNGVTYFKPQDISTENTLPRSVISGYYVNNKLLEDYSNYVSTTDSISTFMLNYYEHDFGFDFVGVGFSLPGRTKYKYMLENYDREWHDIGNLRHINFTNISPGRYVFKVKASDPHGNWEQRGASIVVLIDAPLWRKPWVWAISGLLIGALLIWLNNWRINNLKKRTQQLSKIVSERTEEIQKQNKEIAMQNTELLSQAAMLEEKNIELEKAKGLLEIEVKYFHQRHLLKSSIQTQEEERKRISQDLHDELGAVLSIARMHLVQLRERHTNGINDLKPGLEEACKLTEAALATMRRISHELMPPLLEKFGLVKTIKSIITQINEAKQMVVSFEADDETLRWPVAIELGLYRICMELINNTIKHAHASEIRIQLKQEDDFITFNYCDNGIGLPPVHTLGRGFNNIETRINIMGGSFIIDKEGKKGFYAKALIPSGVAIDL